MYTQVLLVVLVHRKEIRATLNQHPPVHHHPLDACYYSVMDETQLSVNNLVSPW
jgi:hypothetical protein